MPIDIVGAHVNLKLKKINVKFKKIPAEQQLNIYAELNVVEVALVDIVN